VYVNQTWGHRIRLANGVAVARLDDPDWDTIERSIRELDGSTAISLELFHVTPEFAGQALGEDIYDLLPYMGITGGHLGRCSLRVSRPDAPTALLMSTPPAKDATLADVIEAARSFALFGMLNGDLQWELIEVE